MPWPLAMARALVRDPLREEIFPASYDPLSKQHALGFEISDIQNAIPLSELYYKHKEMLATEQGFNTNVVYHE